MEERVNTSTMTYEQLSRYILKRIDRFEIKLVEHPHTIERLSFLHWIGAAKEIGDLDMDSAIRLYLWGQLGDMADDLDVREIASLALVKDLLTRKDNQDYSWNLKSALCHWYEVNTSFSRQWTALITCGLTVLLMKEDDHPVFYAELRASLKTIMKQHLPGLRERATSFPES